MIFSAQIQQIFYHPVCSSHGGPPAKKLKPLKTGGGGAAMLGAGAGAGNTWETVAEEVDMADLVATIGNHCTAYLNTKQVCLT